MGVLNGTWMVRHTLDARAIVLDGQAWPARGVLSISFIASATTASRETSNEGDDSE
jgi:hypothetical protein